MQHCDPCDKDFKNISAHNRFKHPPEAVVAEVPVSEAPASVTAGPVFIPSLQQAGIRISSVGRSVKMLRPICATCQRGRNYPRDWYLRCTHNPYVGRKRLEEKVAVYENLADGRKKVIGEDVIHSWEPWPNWVQVATRPRIDSDKRVLRKRGMGFIAPEEVRSPEYPAGIASVCDYRECFSQVGLKQTRWGRYCRDIEAQLVGQDQRPGALEIGERVENREKREAQLEEVPL